MAAGAAVRFGTNKLLTAWRGQPLYSHLLDVLPRDLLTHTVVVSAYREILAAAAARGFQPVENRHPECGPGRTIRLGLEQLQDMDACLFAVCDQPELQQRSLRRLLTSCRDGICAASFAGKRGNPVVFSSDFFPALLSLPEQKAGSSIIRANADCLSLCEVGCRREMLDVDTPDAFRELAELRLLLLDGPGAAVLLEEARRQMPANVRNRLARVQTPIVQLCSSLSQAALQHLRGQPQTLLLAAEDSDAGEVARRLEEILRRTGQYVCTAKNGRIYKDRPAESARKLPAQSLSEEHGQSQQADP